MPLRQELSSRQQGIKDRPLIAPTRRAEVFDLHAPL
jgi:hypothetical protein